MLFIVYIVYTKVREAGMTSRYKLQLRLLGKLAQLTINMIEGDLVLIGNFVLLSVWMY